MPYTKNPKKQLRLSTKRNKLIQELANNEGISIAEAGRRAGYSHRQTSHQALTGLTNNDTFLLEMDNAGLTEEALFKPIKDALKANHTKTVAGKAHTGKDHGIRLRASELAFLLRGRMKKEGDNNYFGALVLNDRSQTVHNVVHAVHQYYPHKGEK